MANKYIRIYEELGTTNSRVFDSVSINKLYTLASAPEEVKEDIANFHINNYSNKMGGLMKVEVINENKGNKEDIVKELYNILKNR